jgi:hypothetical protein
MLPLHLTCRYYSGLEQPSIIAFLLQMYPEAAKIWTTKNPPVDHSYNDSESSHHRHHHYDDSLETRTTNLTIDSNSSNNEDGACGEELPIHLYCQNHFCNVLVLQNLLIPAYPDSIQTFSSRTGQLPIHMVCERQYFQRVSNKKYDSKINPSSNIGSSSSSTSNSDALIRYCLKLYPPSATIRDLQRGELPFGTALRGYQSQSTLRHILSYHQEAIIHLDQKGRTPLHRYCMMLASNVSGGSTMNHVTMDRDDSTVTLLSFLLQHDTHHVAGTIMDHSGCIPLQYVIDHQNHVSLDIIYTLIRSYPTSIFDLVRYANNDKS